MIELLITALLLLALTVLGMKAIQLGLSITGTDDLTSEDILVTSDNLIL